MGVLSSLFLSVTENATPHKVEMYPARIGRSRRKHEKIMIFHDLGEACFWRLFQRVGEREMRKQDPCRPERWRTAITRKSLIFIGLQGTVGEALPAPLRVGCSEFAHLVPEMREGNDELMRLGERTYERSALLTTLDEACNEARRLRRFGTSPRRLALEWPAARLSNRSRASWPGCGGCRGPGGRSRPSSSAWPAPWR